VVLHKWKAYNEYNITKENMKYTLQQYRNLCFEDNHQIRNDGGEYWWYAKKDTKFTKHCIISFSDYKKALSHIRFWLPIYKRLAINPIDCLDSMLKQLILDDEIIEIANDKNINITKKISKIIAINASIQPKELASLLDVSKMTVSRQLKLFKAI
jgi:hypothetical protein